ncbi:unnamed protein product [Darwinula stevensoni]|uniref:Uncharacterized protein n=1 Tax=Darwinula stevensoni TaxID=69355 RepID=A0A7R8X8A7_9CRUS|nr:unnamed protein product [Darwinula stevensoni]CAG0881367.1 unnamed protein product [Darwinula stevensoni]
MLAMQTSSKDPVQRTPSIVIEEEEEKEGQKSDRLQRASSKEESEERIRAIQIEMEQRKEDFEKLIREHQEIVRELRDSEKRTHAP